MEKDPAAAAQYAIDNPDVPERFLWPVAWHLPDSDPHAALDWASQLPEERQLDTARLVFGEWSKHHPRAAADFVNQLPAGTYRDMAAEAAHRTWAAGDPEAAGAWRGGLGALM